MLLILKLLVAPGLVAGVTLAVRRWGPAIGGWLSGMPVVAGPVLVFILLLFAGLRADLTAQRVLKGQLNILRALEMAREKERQ